MPFFGKLSQVGSAFVITTIGGSKLTLDALWKLYMEFVAKDTSPKQTCEKDGREKYSRWDCCEYHRELARESREIDAKAIEVMQAAVPTALLEHPEPELNLCTFPGISYYGRDAGPLSLLSASWWAIMSTVLKTPLDLADPRCPSNLTKDIPNSISNLVVA